jgi:hypothetical protein
LKAGPSESVATSANDIAITGRYAPIMSGISPLALALINEHISSVGQLEVLLLLRLRAEQWWTAESLDRELRLNETWITNFLKDFCARGFCEQSADSPVQFRYQPKSPELSQALDALAQDYLVRRVSVTDLIYSKRSPVMQAFADAFNLRKGGKNA